MQRADDKKGEIKEEKIPFLHPKVALVDLQPNGCLLADNDIGHILKNTMNKERFATLEKEGYGYVKMNNRHFIAYMKNPLGEGNYGQVVLAQDIQSKEWFALKTQTPDPEKEHAKKRVQMEGKLLVELKQAVGLSQVGNAFQTIMKLAPGMEAFEFRKLNRAIPTIRWLQMSLSILAGIKSLHDVNILHRDIKGENILVDYVTSIATPVDLGFGIKANPGKGTIGTSECGTPGFIAPEISAKMFYSEKSEVYAVGKTIAEFLGLAAGNDVHLLSRDSERFMNNRYLPNLQIRTLILNYLKTMTDDDPDKRPTISEVQAFFRDVIQEHLTLLAKLNNVGILDVTEYLSSSQKQKDDLRLALKTCDEVWLVDSQQRPASDYIRLRNALEEKGVVLGERMFRHGNIKNLIAEIPERMSQLAKDRIDIYFYVTHHNADKPLLKRNVCTLTVTPEKNQNDYGNEILAYLNSTPVDPKHFKYVIAELEKERDRLQSKYGYGHKIGGPRVIAIIDTIYLFTEQNNKHKLTYTALTHQLNSLQHRMIATGVYAEKMDKWFGHKVKSGTNKRIVSMGDQIQEEVKVELGRLIYK